MNHYVIHVFFTRAGKTEHDVYLIDADSSKQALVKFKERIKYQWSVQYRVDKVGFLV